ncbi:MAG: hypothetical protein ACKV1O_10320 [Saprospiraceae bacterium]
MTAAQELNAWVKQHRSLETAADREAFYQTILAKLSGKDSDSLHAGLLALKESIRKRRLQAEKTATPRSEFPIKVFPGSEEEREFLKLLLERMNIAYTMST